MRLLSHVLASIVLAVPVALAAQGPGPADRWVLTSGADAMRFYGGIRDTAATDEASGTLRPAGRLGVRLGLHRAFGSWEVALELGLAKGHVAASNELVSIEDRSSNVNRYRIAPSAGVRLLRIGGGGVGVAVGPTFDRWALPGEDRWRIGGEMRVALHLPVGRFEFENRVAFGISGSPVTRDDLGEDFGSGSLRLLSFGAGLRLGL